MGFFNSLIGNTYTDRNGYLRYKDSGKLVHQHVAEKYVLGRQLYRGEVVHHKDRNKQNNHPSNLHVFSSQAEHERAHWQDAKRHGYTNSFRGFKNTRQKQSFFDKLFDFFR